MSSTLQVALLPHRSTDAIGAPHSQNAVTKIFLGSNDFFLYGKNNPNCSDRKTQQPTCTDLVPHMGWANRPRRVRPWCRIVAATHVRWCTQAKRVARIGATLGLPYTFLTTLYLPCTPCTSLPPRGDLPCTYPIQPCPPCTPVHCGRASPPKVGWSGWQV